MLDSARGVVFAGRFAFEFIAGFDSRQTAALPQRSKADIMRTILINDLTTMYVCICNAVTDREIRSAVELGARSLADLQSTLGVATCCGRCADCASGIVRDACAQSSGAGCGGDD